MLLVSKGLETLLRYDHRNVGRLIVPRSMGRVSETPRAGFLWAADNDAYNGFHEERYQAMIDKVEGVPGCLFVAAPDAVGDADETLRLFDKWLPILADRNIPIALVGQDGMTPDDVLWDHITALFVGGTTAWKLGPEAAELVAEAQRQRKWVHMGRVNTWRRVEYANAIGCDSVDGTSLSMFTDTYLRQFSEYALAPRQGVFR